MGEPLAHSKIGASSMYRWSNCPGSVRLSEGIEQKSSPYAEEGTRAHEIAAELLTTGLLPDNVDPEMAEAIRVYRDEVYRYPVQEARGDVRLIEHRFDLSKIYPGLFGTADCVIFTAEDKILRVIDYKHGAGVPVEVEENEQLMYYALGAVTSLDLPCEQVEIVIVQPRCPHPDGPVRRWRFPADELKFFALDLSIFASATENPNAPLVPGDHCRFCPAAAVCPAIHEKAVAMFDEIQEAKTVYSPEQVTKILGWIPTLEAWIKSVQAYAMDQAQKGNPPPGYKLVERRPTRKWKNEGDVAKFLTSAMHLETNDIFDVSLKSPAQIEKLLEKGERAQLTDFIVSKSSGLTLADEKDPRPAVVNVNALEAFDVVEDS